MRGATAPESPTPAYIRVASHHRPASAIKGDCRNSAHRLVNNGIRQDRPDRCMAPRDSAGDIDGRTL